MNLRKSDFTDLAIRNLAFHKGVVKRSVDITTIEVFSKNRSSLCVGILISNPSMKNCRDEVSGTKRLFWN